MYGSNGADPPDAGRRGPLLHRRPGATSRPATASSRARRPIQGRWKIDGIGLPESVLRKIYFDNAARMLRWRPPGT